MCTRKRERIFVHPTTTCPNTICSGMARGGRCLYCEARSEPIGFKYEPVRGALPNYGFVTFARAAMCKNLFRVQLPQLLVLVITFALFGRDVPFTFYTSKFTLHYSRSQGGAISCNTIPVQIPGKQVFIGP